MKHKIIPQLLILISGIVLAVGASYVHAALFTEPTGAPVMSNKDVPIHVGADQVKNGGLSVGTFLANQNAQFDQQVFLGGTTARMVRGGAPATANSTVNIGGFNVDNSVDRVKTMVDGSVFANSLEGTDLSNNSSRKVCANAAGKLVLCEVVYAAGSVQAWSRYSASSGDPIPCPVPGPFCSNTGQSGVGLPPGSTSNTGYAFTIQACLDKHYTQDKQVTIQWTAGGQQYQSNVTVYANPNSNEGYTNTWFALNYGNPNVCSKIYGVDGPTTGGVPTISNVCIRPADSTIPVAPSQQC